MTPEQFERKLMKLAAEYGEFYSRYAPDLAGNVAVSYYKQNFQNEAWGREKWQEVKRRIAGTVANRAAEKRHPARTTRKILAGDSNDLRRSISIKESGNGKVELWTDPSAFSDSKEPYGRVHNEGLKAGRGAGFTMPKRQFMGMNEELAQLIIDKLQIKLKELTIKT